jgi:hypothetical protein
MAMFPRIVRAAATALVLLVLLLPARTLAAQSCVLEYQRADNMWAAFGRPDGALGTETITLAPGTSRVFVTDWKYEKKRNDGTNYYGSHLRVATNKGEIPATLEVVSAAESVESMLGNILSAVTKLAWNRARVGMPKSTTRQYRADLAVVTCPKA